MLQFQAFHCLTTCYVSDKQIVFETFKLIANVVFNTEVLVTTKFLKPILNVFVFLLLENDSKSLFRIIFYVI